MGEQVVKTWPEKTNWQQTNRKYRYKYTGDNEGKWEYLVGGGDKHKIGETDQGVTISWNHGPSVFLINNAENNLSSNCLRNNNFRVWRLHSLTEEEETSTTQ
jgi:hypothetical protein